MQSILGKMANIVGSLLPGGPPVTSVSKVKDDPIKLQVVDYRTSLTNAICKGKDGAEVIERLIELDCPLCDKYALLQVTELLSSNNQSLEDLKHITSGLAVIVKYAQHLIRKSEQRNEQWRIIHFQNAYVQKKIKPMKGFENVLQQLGYTQVTSNGLSYPSGAEPDLKIVVNLTADMMLFRKEIKQYILGRHPHPEFIQQFVPLKTQHEVLASQQYKSICEDDDMSDATSAQISYVALENSVNNQSIMSPSRQPYLDTDLKPDAQLVQQPSKSQLECNNNSVSNVTFQTASSAPTMLPDLSVALDVPNTEACQSPALQNLKENSECEIEQFQTNTEPAQAIQDLVTTATTNELDTGTLESSSGTSSSLRLACTVCGDDATVFCVDCSNKPLCHPCNENWHKHPQRQGHSKQNISALAYISPPSINPVNIDGAYGISAQNTANLARIIQKRQSQLANERALSNKAVFNNMLYRSESKRSDNGAEDPTESFHLQNQMRSEKMQERKIYQPSDYHQLQDMNSPHQQYLHQQIPPAAFDPYSVSYQSRASYLSPAFMNLDQDQGYVHHLRSDLDNFNPVTSKNQLFNNSGLVNSGHPDRELQQQQHAMTYLQQQMSGHSRHSALQQQQQPPGWYHQGIHNRMHAPYPFNQDLAKSQIKRDLGPVSYVPNDLITNSMYQHSDLGAMHPSTDQMFSLNPQALQSSNDQSTRSSQLFHHQGTILQDKMNAQMNVQSVYSPSLGQIYHPGFTDISGMYIGNKNPHYSVLPMTDSLCSQPGLQEPGYQMSWQHLASQPSSSVCLPNSWIDLLNQETDIKKRCVKCNAYIGRLVRDIKNLEQQINHAMEKDIEVCDTEEFRTLSKKKALMMQQKKGLEEYRRNLEDETILMKMNFDDKLSEEMSQQIHYPPDIDLSVRTSNIKLSNPNTDPDEAPNVAINTADVAGSHSDHKQLINSAPVSSSSDPVLSSQPRLNADEKIYAKVTNSSQVKIAAKTNDTPQYSNMNRVNVRDVQASRVAVEASDNKPDDIRKSPPVLPKRLLQKEDILNKTLLSPKTVVLKEDILNKTFPPPKAVVMPDIKNWQCQHCTYINSASAHVCAMCDRTSDNPQFVSVSDDESSEVIKNDTDNEESYNSLFSRNRFLDMLEALQTEQQQETEFNTRNKADDDDEDDDNEEDRLNADRRQHIGPRISGSQEQVMLEKKRAQKEFMQQQQEQMNNKCSSEVQHPLKCQSPSPTEVPCDMEQKQRPRPGLELSEQYSTSSSDYHTLPSTVPFLPSNTAHNTTSLPHKSLKTGAGLDESKSDGCSSDSKLEDAIARFNEISLIDTMQTQGAEFAKLIKMADNEGFVVEAVQIAQSFCKNQNMDPIEWLKKNWKRNVTMVVNMAITVGNKQVENSVGEVSEEEAETAYINCHGNMKDAAKLCVNSRTELYEQLSALGDYPREEILQAMLQCHGNKEAAERVLIESKLQPFIENIWAEREVDGRNRFALGLASASPEMCHSFSTSIIFHVDFQKMIKNKTVDRDRRIRMIFIEGKLKSWGRAELVIKILDNDLPEEDISLEDVVEAVRNCQDRNSALAYLQQECALCFTNFPMSKIRSLNICQCKMCEQCLAKNFEIGIRERHVRYWTCPLCSLPDMNDAEVASDYLHFLILLLQPLIDKDLQNLFETKVRDWYLQKDASFRWCAHCAEGFLAENQGGHLRMTCPHCQEKTCFKCKKQWEAQHEGLTCEQFAQWKIDNDPTNQSVGLAKHLDENGIDCPNCKMRFALAKGGCMHFKCPQCAHEFCSGCNEPFHQKDVCTKYRSCRKLGLHCHCPRDCFSYLRDRTVQELQQLLKHHNVPFNVSTPNDQIDPLHCPVMEQKEFELGKKDEKCGKETDQGQAGLCEMHYKEYLVVMINRHGLDPVILMTQDEMTNLLHRYDLVAPKQKPKQTPDEHLAQLREMVQEELPLRR